ncbi:MAG: hypothetical protein H6492_01200 [Candidatus Paracaedibacteraceae bacterium]|nr:hypothetical protein [Candidatus Paracaedibacteraceae bacterium]
MPTFLFNKIIREKFLYKLLEQEGTYTSTSLTHDQAIQELKLKLKEEAQEISETLSTSDMLEGLSDILAIVEGLLTAASLTMKDLSSACEAKKAARGKLRIYEKILTVSMPSNDNFHDTITELRSSPQRYPEL